MRIISEQNVDYELNSNSLLNFLILKILVRVGKRISLFTRGKSALYMKSTPELLEERKYMRVNIYYICTHIYAYTERK